MSYPQVLTDLADGAAELTRMVVAESIRRRADANTEPILTQLAERESLIRLRQRSQVVLGDGVNRRLGEFMDACWVVTGVKSPGTAKHVPPDVNFHATQAVLDSYAALLSSIRESLGIDQLSQETLQLIGRSTKQS